MRQKFAIYFLASTVFALSLLVFAPAKAQQALSLPTALQQALRADLRLLQAERKVIAAKLELELLVRNLFIPRLSLSAIPLSNSIETEQTRLLGRVNLSAGMTLPIGTTLSLGYSTTYNYATGQLQGTWASDLTQPLLQDFTLTSTALELQAKQASLREAEHLLRETKNQVLLETLKKILDLTLTQAAIQISQNRVELAQQRYASTQSKAEQGQANRVELLAAEIELRQSELGLAKLQTSFQSEQEKFFRSLGLKEKIILSPAQVNNMKFLASVETLLHKQNAITSEIVQADPEVRKLQAELRTAELELKRVKQEALPRLELRLNFDGINGWGARLDMNWGFLSGLTLRLSEWEKNLELVRSKLDAAKKTTQSTIHAQRDQLQSAVDQLKLFEMRKELIALQQEMKQKQLEGGLISKNDWEGFRVQTREFENQYQSAIYDLILSYLKYRVALGFEFNMEEVLANE
jgi:outer membrane protein TolC